MRIHLAFLNIHATGSKATNFHEKKQKVTKQSKDKNHSFINSVYRFIVTSFINSFQSVHPPTSNVVTPSHSCC